jgi:hypothetical protein
MTEQEKQYYQRIRKQFEDELKIARAVKWSVYLIAIGLGICWVLFRSMGSSLL